MLSIDVCVLSLNVSIMNDLRDKTTSIKGRGYWKLPPPPKVVFGDRVMNLISNFINDFVMIWRVDYTDQLTTSKKNELAELATRKMSI